MSWKEAQAHCRANYTDLATIESDQEMAQLMAIAPKQRVWIGLYRVPWMWSDRTGITFKNWATGEPDNNGGNEHCGCEDSKHFWHDLDCNYTLSFWCEGGKMK